MTFPRLDNDWLMAAPSLSLSPVAPVESARSLFKTKTKVLFIMPTSVCHSNLHYFMTCMLSMTFKVLPQLILRHLSRSNNRYYYDSRTVYYKGF